jgi:hypothetical protein
MRAPVVVDFCLHIANVLYLISFLARDMLWLRILTCFGLVLGVVFFTCQPMPLYGPTVWHVVFLLINCYQIYQLLAERRKLRLTAEQQEYCASTFRGVSREELLTLLVRVMYRNPETIRDIHQMCRQPLTPDEAVLRDIAFRRLARNELLNLLTRRLWRSIKWLIPVRYLRRPEPGTVLVEVTEIKDDKEVPVDPII